MRRAVERLPSLYVMEVSMAELRFYEVDAAYINYLLKTDAKVPRVDYSASSPHDKFLCGIVLSVSGHDYFAPISSFTEQQRTNVVIKNAKGRPLSSIRLSFMIPVPPGVAALKDIGAEPSRSYKFLLYNELRFCNRNADSCASAPSLFTKRLQSGKSLS
jgi:protein AbiQ